MTPDLSYDSEGEKWKGEDNKWDVYIYLDQAEYSSL